MFKYFGRTTWHGTMQVDFTMSVADLINMFRKAKILDTERLSMEEFIDVVERFHTAGSNKRLSEKLAEEKFKAYLRAHADTLKIN